ncbi:MAG TPA: ATP-binding cassette domain-containing protein [Nocardioidaceae bacterium]|nr:ATP-binding cassette domain-containing protein [Nocardioidaceae bacterium]
MFAQHNRTPAGPSAVSVSGLSVAFGAVRALEGIDLSVAPGELVGVTGESGAGKTTLMRCIAGDLPPTTGEVLVAGRPGPVDPGSAARSGIGVVWQDLALVDRLDVAANLLLGRESRGLLWTEARAHALARRTLDDLGIAIPRTTEPAGGLVAGQRQLLAVARAVSIEPDVLLLDEPTAALGVADTAQVERLIQRIHARGTTVLLVSHDVEQLLRLTQRLVVLRHGRLVAGVDPTRTHRDDVIALISGQEVESSAHHQLTRLHALTDRLASADPSSSLLMILSALGAALGARRICMHIADGDRLRLACAFGVPAAVRRAWEELPFGEAGGAMGVAAATEKPVVEPGDEFAAQWAVPFSGSHGLAGVITVLRDTVTTPSRDDLDLVTLYGGYAVAAIERERLVDELTSRNLVLETIREVLETLAGPIPVDGALETALEALLRGMHADEIGLFVPGSDGEATCRARADIHGSGEPGLAEEVAEHRARTAASGRVEPIGGSRRGWGLAVSFVTEDGVVTLAARKRTGTVAAETSALMEDAASSVRLALERERAQAALQEAVALRRSQQLQREFLARLSHELRTPLTAIGGYAESLMQPDVTWDQESHDRFLSRIGAESTRLRRLVEDLLDHSAIESGVLKLHCDWCDLSLLLDAARGCLDPAAQARVAVGRSEGGPVVWADHDRLEQVFLNLMDNAVRHNPPGTRVWVEVCSGDAETVRVEIRDDGAGPPESVAASPFTPHRERRGPSAGAGLGLSIAHAIVVAHGGRIEMEPAEPGTRFSITLPVGNELAEGRDAEGRELTVREVRAHD